jgi:hypothetical protein
MVAAAVRHPSWFAVAIALVLALKLPDRWIGRADTGLRILALALIVTVFLFPLGLLLAVAAAFADVTSWMVGGFGIAALGPILLASSWVFRR